MSDNKPTEPDLDTGEEPPAVADAARKVAAGDPVDWPTLESSAGDEASRDVLERLHAVEGIAAFHRQLQGGLAVPSARVGESQPTWGSLTLIQEIGRGSFGRVYRAWDPRLDREVALKILDQGATSDSPHSRSVVEEGKHLARLRHPNIVTIYGAERVDGQVGLEMELVTGRTLANIVRTQGPFGADEAMLIGRDVARALAAVHRAGLVHRDVKAQNVLREHGGRVVLMDFGAGRPAVQAPPAPASLDIAGTPLYLAPEVLAGSAPTPRSDLYSLGVLLYYLVTGTFPIAARTMDELRAAHLAGKATRLRDARPDLPEAFIQAVEPSLAPVPQFRLDSAGRFEAGLSKALGQSDRATPARSVFRRWALVAGLAAIGVAGGSIAALWPRAAVPSLAVRFNISFDGHLTIPHGPGSREFAISPDGSTLVYATMRAGRLRSHLWLRRFDDLEAREISIEGGQPFFSPDGTSVGAYSNKLITVSLTGGTPVTVFDGEAAGGASWARDGTIVFSSQGNLWRVPETGGTPIRLTTVDADGDEAAIRPHVLPTGDVLFTLRRNGDLASSVAVLTRDGRVKPLIDQATSGQFLPPGYLIFVAGNPPWITGAPFDLNRLEVTGPSAQIQAVRPHTHWFDVSASGSMAFSVPDDIPAESAPRLVWVDRVTGKEQPVNLPIGPGQYHAYSLRVSPDGRRVALTTPPSVLLETVDLAEPGVLTIGDLERGVLGGSLVSQPAHPLAWSRDSTRITYQTQAGAIAWRRADGSGGEEILAEPREGFRCNTGEWSPDGRVLLLGCGARTGAEAHRDVMKLVFPSAAEVGKKPVILEPYFLATPGQGAPRFSRDGRWVAYSSNVPGDTRARVFVRAFPGPGPVIPVSGAPGRFPIWRGNELFYLSTMPMVVATRTQPAFVPNPPSSVPPRFEGYDILNDGRLVFDVSADGRRLLLLNRGEERGGDYLSTLTVVLNWVEEVKRKLARQ